MTVIKKTKNQKLNVFLFRQFKNLAKSITANKSANTIDKIIADNVYAIGKKFDLDQYILALSNTKENEEYSVDFDNYVNLNVKELNSLANNLNCTQLGFYISILSHLSYSGNMIENKQTHKPLKRRELVDSLKITNEVCKNLIKVLVQNKLMFEGDNSNKLALYCPNNVAFKWMGKNESAGISTIKKKNPRTLIFSGYLFEHPVFQKKNRADRKSFGMETLGVFVKIILLMNDAQEVKSRKKIDILRYIKSKINVGNFITHFEILEQSNFVKIKNNIVYINPTASKKYRKSVSENIVQIFNLNCEGEVMHLPHNQI
jgi:hypothetical protein